MGKKVLIIGTYSSEGADSFDWWQELPNLSDYDTVILDTTRIANFWLIAGRLKYSEEDNEYLLSKVNQDDERLRSNLSLVRNKLLEMLEFEVTIYAIFTPKIVVTHELGPEYVSESLGSGKAYARFVSTDSWCPISVEAVAEKGKTILVQDSSYGKYFREFKGWEYYFVPESVQSEDLERYYADRYKVRVNLLPIATNKVMKPVAVECHITFHMWAHEEEEGAWRVVPEKHGGSLILLPTIDRYNTEPLIEILLQRGMEFEETPLPNWIGVIEIPGEASLKIEIAAERQKLETIQAKIEEDEASLAELRKYKRLLYADGLELQDICKSTLERLGAKTKPSPVSDEFMIEVDDKEALVEVKGSTKNIRKDDIGQLITDLGELIKLRDETEPIKGILIGNAWRLSPLDDRDRKEKPLFTGPVIRIAEHQNIGLLPTMELLRAYCKVLEQPDCRLEILDKLINTKGIIRF
jgi:hypothetical protein